MDRDPPGQARLGQLAEEQAALRRVATLVARATPPEEVFAAVAEEVGRLLPVNSGTMGRYESDGTLTFVAHWGRAVDRFPVGTRRPLGGYNLGTLVFETGRSVRVDGYADSTSGALGNVVREAALRSAVGTPIIVEGRLWGLIAAGSSLEQPLPPDTEARLASFTELVATAIANTESRAALARLAEEQAALRRVATLVARATPPEQVFAAVAAEVGRLLAVDFATLVRYDPQDTLEVAGAWTRTGAPAPTPVGGRLPLGGRNVTTLVYQSGRPPDRLQRCLRRDRPGRLPGLGAALLGRRAGQRRGPAVGLHGRGVQRPGAAAAAGRHRGAAGLVHRAGGDRDREHREPCRSRPAG